MLIIVEIKFFSEKNGGRKTIPGHGYRPDWVSNSKPEYNCARILEPLNNKFEFDKTSTSVIEPLRPELWTNISNGDILYPMEGTKKVGEAKVINCVRYDR